MTRILAINGSYRDDGITDQAVAAVVQAAEAVGGGVLEPGTAPGQYWPWAMNAPQLRKAGEPGKKAVLITSCAAPAILGRWAYGTRKQLQMTAKTIGAEPLGTLSIGMIARRSHPVLPLKAMKKAQALGRKLAAK